MTTCSADSRSPKADGRDTVFESENGITADGDRLTAFGQRMLNDHE